MTMPSVVPPWCFQLGDHLWQSTVFFALVWMLTVSLKRRSARVRHSLWIMASLKFLLPLSLFVAVGASLPMPSRLSKHAQPRMHAPFIAVSEPFTAVGQALISAPNVSPPRNIRRGVTEGVVVAIGATWLVGFLYVLLQTTGSQVALKRRIPSPVSSGCDRELGVFQNACAVDEMSRRTRNVTLIVTNRSTQLGVVGIWRPKLLWPGALSKHLTDEQMEAIFSHELAHIKYQDNLSLLFHRLVEALYWFLPTVWWIEKKIKEERELACDEWSIRRVADRGLYAEALLKTVRFCMGASSPGFAGIAGGELNRRVATIMTGRTQRLGVVGKIAIVALFISVGFVPMAYGLIHAMPMFGQVLHAEGAVPEFAAASVRPSSPDELSKMYAPSYYVSTKDGFGSKNATLKDLVGYAYGVSTDNEVSGGPSWIDTDKFDVNAKLDPAEFEAYSKLSRDDKDEKTRLMVQRLLEQRFGLHVRFEKKELPVFELVLLKDGPKCAKQPDTTGLAAMPQPRYRTAPPPPPPPPPGWTPPSPEERQKQSFHLHTLGWPFWLVVNFLSHQPELHGRTLIDKTGLTGSYECDLVWAREGTTATEPSFFQAIQDSMGMKMVPAKDPVETVVIEAATKPTPQDQS